jgi:hypothetical protein
VRAITIIDVPLIEIIDGNVAAAEVPVASSLGPPGRFTSVEPRELLVPVVGTDQWRPDAGAA